MNQGGLRRAAIFNVVEASLRTTLLLQIHRFRSQRPRSRRRWRQRLHDLVKVGKVRYIGASSMWVGVSVRDDAVLCGEERVDEVCQHAESV